MKMHGAIFSEKVHLRANLQTHLQEKTESLAFYTIDQSMPHTHTHTFFASIRQWITNHETWYHETISHSPIRGNPIIL